MPSAWMRTGSDGERMNQEDILKMAREADPDFDSDPEDMPFCLMGMDAVERFAALVAAKAAQYEREACAALCEEREDYRGEHESAIRARGQ